MEEGNSNNQHEREEEDHDYQERGGGGGSTVGGARWNPTKEQIGILERMYSEGIRTPSADQIQQITARLRVYGHIEGKNVFYWFQNHKARQRQKLRQERLAAAAAASGATANRIVNPHFLGPNHPFNPTPNPSPNPSISNVNLNPRTIFPAPPHHPSYNPHHHHPHYHISPNHVICSSYYLPQTNPGFYTPPHPHHHYSAPAAADHPRSSKHGINTTTTDQMPRGGIITSSANDHHHNQVQGIEYMGVRTLDLFPVHPTGILEHKLGGGSSSNNNNNNSGDQNNNNSSSKTCSSEETHTTNYDNGDHNMQQRIFDFFSRGHASSASH